jgi:uncharacterized membrane protein YsdA (DUF1294 family)
MNYNTLILIIYVAWLLIFSIISFLLFIIDKKKAIKGAQRIKEKTLLESVVIGGAIGGFIGRIVARHKTNKSYFSFTIYLSLLIEIIVAVILVMLLIK